MDEALGRLAATLDDAALDFVEACVRRERERRAGPAAEADAARPGRRFTVPDNVKHLTTEQLDTAAGAFRAWYEAAATASEIRARGRIWLVFLLIRHGALRLGEVQALDDCRDLDFARALVQIRGGAGEGSGSETGGSAGEPGESGEGRPARELQFPEAVMRDMREILETPAMCGLRGEVLHLDQGYVRRKFYERADACGLPRALLSPRVIRHSRGIELLRGDVPLNIVQRFLGQQTPTRTARYLDFSQEEARRIVSHHLRREAARKTSARNVFAGTVRRVRRGGVLAEVRLDTPGGLEVVAVITVESATSLGIREGAALTASIKAPWIVLCPEPAAARAAGEASRAEAANCFPGIVADVRRAEVEAEVLVDLAEGSSVCALITVQGADGLGLAPGAAVRVLFSPFAVILGIE